MIFTSQRCAAVAVSGLAMIGAMAVPATANELPAPLPIPAEDAALDSIFEPIDDYAPSECTGQISNSFIPSTVQERISSLTQNFSQSLTNILASAAVETCVGVSATRSDTTLNINYLHEIKGVYKLVMSAEPTTADAENYLYTYDVLSVRYIPYKNGTELNMDNSVLRPAIGGTCILDDLDYPYEADCTFAIADEENARLSVGKLHYYF